MYKVSVFEQSDGSNPCEYVLDFETLSQAWYYMHFHNGYQEYYLKDLEPGFATPVLIPPGSDIEPEYWTDYSCSLTFAP